jgi:hypothetical protein
LRQCSCGNGSVVLGLGLAETYRVVSTDRRGNAEVGGSVGAHVDREVEGEEWRVVSALAMSLVLQVRVQVQVQVQVQMDVAVMTCQAPLLYRQRTHQNAFSTSVCLGRIKQSRQCAPCRKEYHPYNPLAGEIRKARNYAIRKQSRTHKTHSSCWLKALL